MDIYVEQTKRIADAMESISQSLKDINLKLDKIIEDDAIRVVNYRPDIVSNIAKNAENIF